MRNFSTVLLVFLAISAFIIYQSFISDDLDDNYSSIICEFEHGPCTFENQFGQFLLKANPEVIRTESEIIFQLSHYALESVTIESAYLEGRDMYMGRIPLFFEKRNGRLLASTMLGACIEDEMVWQMIVNAKLEDVSFTMTYYFSSYQ